MGDRTSPILRTARANQHIEDDVMARLEDARTMRDLCWQDFFANLDTGDTDRIRTKMLEWESRDNEVAHLEGKAGLYNQHRTWCANYEKLVEAGYKEA